jgi:hypothetical protein
MRRQLEIATDHFQFFVGDGERGPAADTRDLWASGGTVKSGGVLIAVPTTRFGGRTKIEVELASARSPGDEAWTQLGEFSLAVPSGSVTVWAPENRDPERMVKLPVPPGDYSGVAYSRGAETVTDEMATSGDDSYRIVIWPA